MAAIAVAILSLLVSSVTAWLTLFRVGAVRMTQPTVIFLGPDTPSPSGTGSQKVFLRTLLFATSQRGRVIESMHVTLTREGVLQSFDIWVYGERNQLVRGSGLFVGEAGLAANHHFLASRDASSLTLVDGTYQLDVYAHLLGAKRPQLMFTQNLVIDPDAAASLVKPGTGIYFDWEPAKDRYISHLDRFGSHAETRLGAGGWD